MTDDIVARLRCYADIDDAVYHPWVYGEAADEIERLRAALREIADGPRDADKSYVSLLHEIQSEARAALGEASDDAAT
jgi:hypothetical protein